MEHREKMQRHKERVDQGVAQAQDERGVVILLSGKGKGKSTSAFGMIMRSLGHGKRVGLVQFVKGAMQSGEELYLKATHPEIPFYQMGTGFTWETQDREADIAAAERTWAFAEKLLADETLHLVVLDELTYMLGYKYLDEDMVLNAIRSRPPEQTVVVTGRGGGSGLRELADTVAEIENAKHAFAAGVKARAGVDF